MDFKYRRHFKAMRGAHGQGKNMHGAGGEDLMVKVPVGTIIRDDESGAVIADLTKNGQEIVVARGGRVVEEMPDLPPLETKPLFI